MTWDIYVGLVGVFPLTFLLTLFAWFLYLTAKWAYFSESIPGTRQRSGRVPGWASD